MALEINNAQFSQFVQFAEQQMQAGKSKAVARVGDAQVGPLAGRTITAAKGEFVGNIWRSVDTRNANDIARPLTARRILAVNKAINAEMTTLAKKFGMTGGGGGSILSMITSNSDILQSPNPAREFKALMNRHATASIATHLAARASENLDYASFDLDVKRGMGITIDGKRAPQDPAAAHDRIAQFLTGNKTATFNGLDDLTQRKARFSAGTRRRMSSRRSGRSPSRPPIPTPSPKPSATSWTPPPRGGNDSARSLPATTV